MYHTILRKRIREKGLLHSAMLELTYRCNLDCFFCYNDKNAAGAPLVFEDYLRLFDDLASMQTLFLTFTGGEPMTHPRFFDLGVAARERGFAVRLRTNGHSLRSAVAARVQAEIDPVLIEMSLHGACAATHERQTRAPGSFSRLIANIRGMKALGLPMNLVSTLTRWNETELDAMFALADALEVRLRFQGPVGPRDNGDLSPMRIQPSAAGWACLQELIAQRAAAPPENAPPQTGEDLAVARPTSEAKPYHCGVGSEEVHIDPFGNVSPCLHLRWSIGNLREQSITQIWQHSPVLEQARQLAAHTARRWAGGQKPMQFGAPLFCPGVALKTGSRLVESSST